MTDEKPDEAPATGGVARVTKEEMRASFGGPAFRSNKMILSMTENGPRIAFMEQHGDVVPPVFRTAVVLSVRDALSLRDLITGLVGGIEDGIKKAVKAAEAASEAKKDDGA